MKVIPFSRDPNYGQGWAMISHMYPNIDFWALTPFQLDVLSDHARTFMKRGI